MLFRFRVKYNSDVEESICMLFPMSKLLCALRRSVSNASPLGIIGTLENIVRISHCLVGFRMVVLFINIFSAGISVYEMNDLVNSVMSYFSLPPSTGPSLDRSLYFESPGPNSVCWWILT